MAQALPDPDAMVLLARRLPKAELHQHLTGSLRPSSWVRATAHMDEPAGIPRLSRAFDNLGYHKFFSDLDEAARLMGGGPGIVAETLRMIESAFDAGVRHLEVMCTPALHAQAGVDIETALRSVGEGLRIAHGELGMSGGIIVELHRPDGADAAIDTVRRSRDLRAAGLPILGYGSDGNHRNVPLATLAPAYELARSEGFPLTGHAMSLDDVAVALDLGFERIDHGWIAATDTSYVRRLVASGAVMTLTPMAYLLGGHAAPIHWTEAATVLYQAGVPLVVATDDPALHHTDLAHSYELMARGLHWTPAELAEAARVGFRSAWSATTDVEDIVATIDALAMDPRRSPT